MANLVEAADMEVFEATEHEETVKALEALTKQVSDLAATVKHMEWRQEWSANPTKKDKREQAKLLAQAEYNRSRAEVEQVVHQLSLQQFMHAKGMPEKEQLPELQNTSWELFKACNSLR